MYIPILAKREEKKVSRGTDRGRGGGGEGRREEEEEEEEEGSLLTSNE